MLRATWVAQELLNTFQMEIGEIALIPSSGGIFEVRANGNMVWSLKEEGRFPEPKELKQRVRDEVAPGRSLGHADK
jgi:selenoprotein W-related protein